MPRIQHSISIARSPEDVFRITNDIERWPELFNEYSKAKVLKYEEAGRFAKLTFQLSNQDATWRSWRLLDFQELVAIAEREDPLYPFAYMHLKWTYTPEGNGTLMTWTQDFEMDPKFEVPLETVIERMKSHTRENQQRIKEIIESGRV